MTSPPDLVKEVAKLKRNVVATQVLLVVVIVCMSAIVAVFVLRPRRVVDVDLMNARMVKTTSIMLEPGKLDDSYLNMMPDKRLGSIPSPRDNARRQSIGLKMFINSDGLVISDDTSDRRVAVGLIREMPGFNVHLVDEHGEVIVPTWQRLSDRVQPRQ